MPADPLTHLKPLSLILACLVLVDSHLHGAVEDDEWVPDEEMGYVACQDRVHPFTLQQVL